MNLVIYLESLDDEFAMRIETFAEQLLFITLRIETTQSIGTGFIVSHSWLDPSSDNELTGLFLVSNKHVIGDSTCGKLTITRKFNEGSDLTLGNHDTLDVGAGFGACGCITRRLTSTLQHFR